MQKKVNIACFGNFGWDVINIEGEEKKRVLGGSAWRFAQIMAFFRIPTLIVSGMDREKDWQGVMGVLKKNKISFFLKKVNQLPIFRLDYNKDFEINRFLLKKGEEIEKVLEEQIREISFFSHPSQLIHICPLSLDLVEQIIAKKRDEQTEISLQLHFSTLSFRNFERWKEILPRVDYLFASCEDLSSVIKPFSLEKAKKISQLVNKVLFLTCGKKGAYLFEKGELIGDIPAISLPGIKDPTGAGDAFAAGVIAGLFLFKNKMLAVRLATLLSFLNLMGFSSEAIFSLLKIMPDA